MNAVMQPVTGISTLWSELPEISNSWWRYVIASARAIQRESTEFNDSMLIAFQLSMQASRKNPLSLMETLEVLTHSRDLLIQGATASSDKALEFLSDQAQESWSALLNTVLSTEGEKFSDFMRREAEVMESVANFHEQMEAIKDEFGFHFNTEGYELAAETDGFLFYQVLPNQEGVQVRDDLKPVILVPPYMLGVHILSFLPAENKSYAHAFANEGIPTYVRVVKDIMEEEKVQTMTPEDDCNQTLEFCRQLTEQYGQPVALNGTCQGGYISLMNILSGKLDGVCDTLITNVAPIDGTCSRAMSGMPSMHHDFITTTLPNGNEVANGYLLSLGMRFVAIDRETPLIKVLDQASLHRATELNPGKTVAALFRWLLKERVHLPLGIANMSSHSFHEPVSAEGNLPVELYGKPLNVGDLADLKIRWYQDYALKDDLVTPACATAANKFLDGTDVLESVPFPGGHVGILTSPHNKRSPVNGEFKGKDGATLRGPVKFLLDLTA
jgi:hypothetical protein